MAEFRGQHVRFNINLQRSTKIRKHPINHPSESIQNQCKFHQGLLHCSYCWVLRPAFIYPLESLLKLMTNQHFHFLTPPGLHIYESYLPYNWKSKNICNNPWESLNIHQNPSTHKQLHFQYLLWPHQALKPRSLEASEPRSTSVGITKRNQLVRRLLHTSCPT